MAKAKLWIEKAADMTERHAQKHRPDQGSIVCASGISPSGPIHIGNLREEMTVHLVAEELRRRGHTVDHIHSWDDFDRLRKIPASVPKEFEKYIGQPLAEIPDPFDEHPSYADRFISDFEQSMEQLGVEMRSIRQAKAYRNGAYVEQIKLALEKRAVIFDCLVQYQTEGRHEESLEARREKYYPFQIYCHACNRDSTVISNYQADTATLSYACTTCKHEATFSLNDECPGKLVWKADWPMRWHFEKVAFEPGGDDHGTPGSSYTVGKEIIRDVYDDVAPCFIKYAFVGMGGATKISSSSGGGATPADALRVLEPAMLRWLYVRRDAGQQFNVEFGDELIRAYDEWDKLSTQVANETASEKQIKIYNTAKHTATAEVRTSDTPVSFRLLSSVADIANGDLKQILRIVGDHLDDHEIDKDSLEPRLSCALNWLEEYVPTDQRTHVQASFDQTTWDQLEEQQKECVSRFIEMADTQWDLKNLTSLVYGVPKLSLGFELDSPPNDDIKTAQRSFFVAMYQLMVDSETGPRLPTLLLSLGQERVLGLLTPPATPSAANLG
ncbi:MAG: lysine--tRNA ligase [Gammaproteobacteria bacterium]|nr:lysine--tRNA ligase [Gammaproteobacteria bacterium]